MGEGALSVGVVNGAGCLTVPDLDDTTPPPSAALPARVVGVWFSAQAARLTAAFRSRSITSPHSRHSKVRSLIVRSLRRVPQAEQVLDDGNHRSATRTWPPRQPCFYVICRASSPHAASEMARESLRLDRMPVMFRSSRTSRAWFLTSWLDT